jgi:hypothetical protein
MADGNIENNALGSNYLLWNSYKLYQGTRSEMNVRISCTCSVKVSNKFHMLFISPKIVIIECLLCARTVLP